MSESESAVMVIEGEEGKDDNLKTMNKREKRLKMTTE